MIFLTYSSPEGDKYNSPALQPALVAGQGKLSEMNRSSQSEIKIQFQRSHKVFWILQR